MNTSSYNPIDVIFGSNRFLGTNGIISVEGKELFKMQLESGGRVLITTEIRDKNDLLLGKIWKSTSFVHWDKSCEPIHERQGNELKRLALKDKRTEEVIFELIFHAKNSIEINGTFYVKGLNFPIIATKDYLDLNTNKFIKNVKIMGNKGIEIENDSIGI